jgi:hypothetical protein
VTALHAHIPEAPGGLLASESAVRAGALIGYAWVNTSGQLLDRLQHALAQVMTGALACVAVLTPPPARCPHCGARARAASAVTNVSVDHHCRTRSSPNAANRAAV